MGWRISELALLRGALESCFPAVTQKRPRGPGARKSELAGLKNSLRVVDAYRVSVVVGAADRNLSQS